MFDNLNANLSRRKLLLGALALGSGAATVAGRAYRARSDSAVSETQTTRSAGAGEQPKIGGTLRIVSPYDIVPATVPHILSQANFPLYGLVYESLVTYDGQLVPHP